MKNKISSSTRGRGVSHLGPPPSSPPPPYFPRRDIWKANWGLGSRAHRKFLVCSFLPAGLAHNGP
nr:MAG TPA: hypothetical protein [Caudoviricetes sp.]